MELAGIRDLGPANAGRVSFSERCRWGIGIVQEFIALKLQVASFKNDLGEAVEADTLGVVIKSTQATNHRFLTAKKWL